MRLGTETETRASFDVFSIATATLIPRSGRLEEYKYSVRTADQGDRVCEYVVRPYAIRFRCGTCCDGNDPTNRGRPECAI